MAENKRIATYRGMISDPPRLVPTEDGKLPASVVSKLNAFLTDVITAINGRISFGDGYQASRSGNIDGQWITFTAPSVADTQFEIPHDLGRRPTGYSVWRRDDYALLKDANVGGWDEKRIYMKSNTGGATYLILLI